MFETNMNYYLMIVINYKLNILNANENLEK